MPVKSGVFRLFVGISLPGDVRARLAALQNEIAVAGAWLVDPADFHLTLAFIGGVDARAVEAADEALYALKARRFDLALAGMGCFTGGHGPHHLWAGVAENDALMRLKAKVDRALDAAGVPFERRKFTPHVTLARLKADDDQNIAAFIQRHSLFKLAPFTVEDIALYRSHMDAPPPRYEVLERYVLGV